MCHPETSEELTDWDEEFESSDEDDIQSKSLHQISEPFAVFFEERYIFIKPTLKQAKQVLTDHLTRQFWTNFHRYQKQNHGSSTGFMDEGATGQEPRYGMKRNHDEIDAQSCAIHANDVRGSKRPRATPNASRFSDAVRKFACPYRKHDPRKYCVPNWGPCALTPLQTVARVKAHLYRHHRVHQCQRCKQVFDSQKDLDAHVEAIEGCEVQADQGVDGVTGKIKERLQSRKKAYPGQTEADRWEEVYQVLFPNEEVPSPYFEPIRDHHDDDINLTDPQEVANFEDYFRRELPRFFQTALESAVSHEMQPIEERLRRKMLSVLDEAQKLAFSKYRSIMGSSAVNSPVLGSENEASELLNGSQSLSSQKGAQSTSNDTHKPSILPPLLHAESAFYFSNLENSKAHKLQRDSLDANGHTALQDEEQKTLRMSESNINIDSSPKSRTPTAPAAETEGSLPLPDHVLLRNNTPPTFSDGLDNLTQSSDEWALSMFTSEPSLFNWSPSWETTSATEAI